MVNHGPHLAGVRMIDNVPDVAKTVCEVGHVALFALGHTYVMISLHARMKCALRLKQE
jgi:hypothetical protein